MLKQSKKPLNSLLSVKDLQLGFGNENILNNVSFEVEEGDLIAIVGPNGAGKTTLFKAILGLLSYKGEILFEGVSVESNLKKMAYVPQKFEFDKGFPLTVKELLEISAEKDLGDLGTFCNELGIAGMMSQLIGELSGGQMQRVLIARALLSHPKLILLDEPTSGIDQKGQKTFYDLVSHLNKDHGLTVLMISHELNMVYRHCSKVICLNRSMLSCQSVEGFSFKNMEEMYGDSFVLSDHQHCHH